MAIFRFNGGIWHIAGRPRLCISGVLCTRGDLSTVATVVRGLACAIGAVGGRRPVARRLARRCARAGGDRASVPIMEGVWIRVNYCGEVCPYPYALYAWRMPMWTMPWGPMPCASRGCVYIQLFEVRYGLFIMRSVSVDGASRSHGRVFAVRSFGQPSERSSVHGGWANLRWVMTDVFLV